MSHQSIDCACAPHLPACLVPPRHCSPSTAPPEPPAAHGTGDCYTCVIGHCAISLAEGYARSRFRCTFRHRFAVCLVHRARDIPPRAPRIKHRRISYPPTRNGPLEHATFIVSLCYYLDSLFKLLSTPPRPKLISAAPSSSNPFWSPSARRIPPRIFLPIEPSLAHAVTVIFQTVSLPTILHSSLLHLSLSHR